MTAEAPDPQTARLKRIRFRSWHRGTREMDLLMGGFADANLAALTEEQLQRYEALIEVPDDLLYVWVSGKDTPPPEFDTDVFALLKAHKLDPVND